MVWVLLYHSENLAKIRTTAILEIACEIMDRSNQHNIIIQQGDDWRYAANIQGFPQSLLLYTGKAWINASYKDLTNLAMVQVVITSATAVSFHLDDPIAAAIPYNCQPWQVPKPEVWAATSKTDIEKMQLPGGDLYKVKPYVWDFQIQEISTGNITSLSWGYVLVPQEVTIG